MHSLLQKIKFFTCWQKKRKLFGNGHMDKEEAIICPHEVSDHVPPWEPSSMARNSISMERNMYKGLRNNEFPLNAKLNLFHFGTLIFLLLYIFLLFLSFFFFLKKITICNYSLSWFHILKYATIYLEYFSCYTYWIYQPPKEFEI